MYLVADFSKMKSIADYEKLVQDKLSKMDVGILILNAGVGGLGERGVGGLGVTKQ